MRIDDRKNSLTSQVKGVFNFKSKIKLETKR